MSVDAPHILCVGFDTETETQIRSAFEDRQSAAELSTAPGRSEAIDRLEANAELIDCVISSNALADASGTELLRTVRDSFPELPCLLFVEDLTSDLINDAIDAGVTDYVPRDGSETQASRLVDRALDVISQVQATAYAAEQERINTTVRELTRELIHASTREEIDERVCELLSRSDPYLFAWIGAHDPDSQVVTGRAAAGVEEGYLGEITITTDERPTAQGPTGKAVQTHEIQVMQNIPADPAYELWREEALKRGYRSSAAIPLVYEETLYGVLNVYADRTNAFDTEELAVLEELSTTIAYAYHDMEVREEARRFRRAVEQAADAIFITDTDGTIEYVNPAFEELTGYAADEAVGRTPQILKSGEQPIQYYESMWETILQGDVWESEIINATRPGEHFYAEQTIAPLRDESDTVEGFVAIQRDITERKERERELEEYETLWTNLPIGVGWADQESGGELLEANDRLVAIAGASSKDELLEQSITDLWIDTEGHEVFFEALETTGAATTEAQFKRLGGQLIWGRVTAFVRDKNGTTYIDFVFQDIPDQKEYENALEASQKELRQIIDLVPDLIFAKNRAGEYLLANEATAEAYGLTPEEVEGKREPEIIPSAEEADEFRADDHEVIESGEPKEIPEEELTTADGETKILQTTKIPYEASDSGEEAVLGYSRDITELKKRERELERSKDRLRLLFDEAPDGIVVHDLEGEVLDVNETLIEKLGYTREELLSMDVFDFEVGIDEELVRSEWESMDPGSIHKAEVEGTHRRKDCSTYPCEVWISRVEGGSQERDRFIALTRDVTDRKQREREQREIQQRLELAVETANAGVWEWDIEAETVFWEASMERVLGLEPGTFDGTYEAFIERVHPEDRSTVEETFERALQRRTGFEQEFRFRHTSGEFIWILVRARLFTDSENAPERMIGVGIDISERIDQTRQLEVLDRVLRHNLRNDMTTIQGFAETIQADVDGVTDETGVIIETSRELMKTVEKEREIVELLSDRPDRQTFDIVGVCQRVVADIREEHPEAAVGVTHPETAAVTAIQQIGRAIGELIDNALVHNDREPPEVSLDVSACEDAVRIEVADNGPGIPEEEVNVLTREYEIEPLYHGSGLGLWLVNWIVKLSGGTLAFEENEPHGSIIRIKLNQPT